MTRAKDAGLAVVVLLAQSAPFLFSERVGPGGAWRLVEFLPVLGSALPVAFRRRAPLLCLLLTEACIGWYAVLGSGPAQPIWYGALIGLYTVAHQAPPRHRVAALVITAVGLLGAVGSLTTAVREGLTWSAAFALGALARTRRELDLMSAAQAAELAAARERARIASDMHDILGHAFSLMVVQAEAGGALAGRDPQRSVGAFDAIAAAGRDAMGQLRATVGELRDGMPRAPQPGLADLPDLARQAEKAGLAVRLHVDGTPRELPADVQLAVYRVAQEAFTNVVRHARASTVELRTAWTADEFRLTVADDGVGPGPGPGTGAGTAAGAGGGGHGLVGMGERVTAAGGVVTAGAGPAGHGFTVEAIF
jgi:signal transduction histidine kinase